MIFSSASFRQKRCATGRKLYQTSNAQAGRSHLFLTRTDDPLLMTRRRWIADEVFDNRAALTGEHASHLTRVLRAEIGQEFDIATGSKVRHGRIVKIGPDRIEFELGEEVTAAADAGISLLLSIFKFDRMEWAIEKCTELGVSRIVPVIARRTDAHLGAAAVKRTERWGRIALQAAEQSRRTAPPEIAAPMKLQAAAGAVVGVRIVLSESENEAVLMDVLRSHAGEDVTLAIGPEGGWAEDELVFFRNAGWISASMGTTILRSETAAMAATAIALAART
jgi:16S rRNA (uracil1498-N3)-methyltransferase